MDNLLKILLLLGVGLFVMVFLAERVAKPIDEEQTAKLSRWILPLIAVLLVVQLMRHYFA